MNRLRSRTTTHETPATADHTSSYYAGNGSLRSFRPLPTTPAIAAGPPASTPAGSVVADVARALRNRGGCPFHATTAAHAPCTERRPAPDPRPHWASEMVGGLLGSSVSPDRRPPLPTGRWSGPFFFE